MASVMLFVENGVYDIDYSIPTGEIRSFEFRGDDKTWRNIDDESEKLTVVESIIIQQSRNPERGYSAFIYKLIEEGKIKLPDNQANPADTKSRAAD